MNPVKLKAVAWGVGIVVAALLAALGWQTHRLTLEQRDHAESKSSHATVVAEMEKKAREAVDEARTEERRRVTALEAIVNETEQKLDQARADADANRSAGQRLRAQIAAITASCRGATSDSSPASTGSPADTTADLLADVQRRLDEASDGIAEFADRAHAAGNACQQGYGTLTK